MIFKLKYLIFLSIVLFLIFASINAWAQDPGDDCDPDSGIGYTATLVSCSGTIKFFDHNGEELQVKAGNTIPAGTTIETGPEANGELALEDGTASRSSRLRISPETRFAVKGGLYCSDLRPKADGGRWSAREVQIELLKGNLDIEIAEGVSHSFNLDITTPNSVIRMARGTQDRMSAEIGVTSHKDIRMIPIIEHYSIKSQIAGLLRGRSIQELSEREKEAVMQQATLTAFSLGLLDIDKLGLLDNPQLRSTADMMTQGRDLSELDESEKGMIKQAVAGMALQMGLLKPEELRVPSRPDEDTYIAVHQGRLRVHNKHRGYKRDEVTEVNTGKYIIVKGYDTPESPQSL